MITLHAIAIRCLDSNDNGVQGNVQRKKTHVLLEMIVFTVIRTLTK